MSEVFENTSVVENTEVKQEKKKERENHLPKNRKKH